ncbi:MAG: tetraacyldisaccharide 4'-kinase [Alphaproteobacteria bacterium]
MPKAPDFWYQPPSSWARILSPISDLYGMGVAISKAFARPKAVSAPVICLGNVTAGGTGKTPLAMALAKRIEGAHFLSRGYKGKLKGPLLVDPAVHTAQDVGDEPLLLAQVAPTWIGANRHAAAEKAIAAGAKVLIMDDGLQHETLIKDVSILVIDGARGLGNEHMIPAGPLREPLKDALRKVAATIVVGVQSPETKRQLQHWKTPLWQAHPIPVELPKGPVTAFAGIGNPDKFFAMLEQNGCTIAHRRAFPDHHAFTSQELTELANLGKPLVTTEKDYVRLPFAARDTIMPVKITIELEDWSPLDALMAEAIS